MDLPKSPWVYMAENVLEDLLESFENVKEEVKSPKLEDLKPTLVGRVGKVLFHRLVFPLILMGLSANLSSI